jgi:hypothetical protein
MVEDGQRKTLSILAPTKEEATRIFQSTHPNATLTHLKTYGSTRTAQEFQLKHIKE